MRTITIEKLQAATSEGDVVEVVREYVGEWMPEEFGRLPIECRPGKLRDAEDLNNLALNIALACGSFDLERADLRILEEMDAFVGQACLRLAQIQRVVPPPPANLAESPHF